MHGVAWPTGPPISISICPSVYTISFIHSLSMAAVLYMLTCIWGEHIHLA